MVARVRPPLLLGLGLLLACPPGGSSTGSTGSASASTGPTVTSGDQPTGTTGDACMGSADCETEAICVADYDGVDTMPPGGMRGDASCSPRTDCIGALDLSRWCFDHQGCCDDLRCRPADGVCEPATLGQSTGVDSDTDPGLTSTSSSTGDDTTAGTTGADTTTTTGTSSTG